MEIIDCSLCELSPCDCSDLQMLDAQILNPRPHKLEFSSLLPKPTLRRLLELGYTKNGINSFSFLDNPMNRILLKTPDFDEDFVKLNEMRRELKHLREEINLLRELRVLKEDIPKARQELTSLFLNLNQT